MNDQEPRSGQDWVEDAKTEIIGMGKEGMHHPSTKPVLTGAAIGAAAGALLPVISWPIGLAIGAGFAFYQRIRK
ncbi:hypothetical protein [Porphyrobacter sp. LM 6]|jgi:hypothetical protein|uniref:hypothetical protein n=1 Tax=Porphyrobacter sp. LM 6 TaxID=1896196 RepID=UPI00084781E8|nr:hypothetical protein [Porphyrobacter sp. LM 6]AOL94769.1 hypothetical protein BG023_111850 [Porphyrobacter sp. LM 6]